MNSALRKEGKKRGGKGRPATERLPISFEKGRKRRKRGEKGALPMLPFEDQGEGRER